MVYNNGFFAAHNKMVLQKLGDRYSDYQLREYKRQFVELLRVLIVSANNFNDLDALFGAFENIFYPGKLNFLCIERSWNGPGVNYGKTRSWAGSMTLFKDRAERIWRSDCSIGDKSNRDFIFREDQYRSRNSFLQGAPGEMRKIKCELREFFRLR